MENISKVLVITASVLMALIIVGMSILIFNIVKNPVAKAVDNMSSEERTFFNSKFQRYEGGRVTGLETKALINVMLQNATLQVGDEEVGRIPESVVTYYDRNTGSKIVLRIDRNLIDNTNNPDVYRTEYQKVLNNIRNTQFYSVETELNARNGIVSLITIEELNL